MAYGNWGAFVWKNGELRKDCCDSIVEIPWKTSSGSSGFHLDGHAIIDCGVLIFEFYKKYFPSICEKQDDGTYLRWNESEFLHHYGVDKLEHQITADIAYMDISKCEETMVKDLYLEVDGGIVLEYRGFRIEFYRDYFYGVGLNTCEITTPDGDVWYCVYGMSFGNGYDDSTISRCHNKYLHFHDNQDGYRTYWYIHPEMERKMLEAMIKDDRRHVWSNIKYYLKVMAKDFIKLKWRCLSFDYYHLRSEYQKL